MSLKYMHKNIRIVLAFAMATAGSLFGQTSPRPVFDAASVKLSAPMDARAMMSGRARIGIKIDSGRINIANTSLFDVIAGAYRLKAYQLTGPDWMKSVMVDIVA